MKKQQPNHWCAEIALDHVSVINIVPGPGQLNVEFIAGDGPDSGEVLRLSKPDSPDRRVVSPKPPNAGTETVPQTQGPLSPSIIQKRKGSRKKRSAKAKSQSKPIRLPLKEFLEELVDLKKQNEFRMTELKQDFDNSEATLRKRLSELVKLGVAKKVTPGSPKNPAKYQLLTFALPSEWKEGLKNVESK